MIPQAAVNDLVAARRVGASLRECAGRPASMWRPSAAGKRPVRPSSRPSTSPPARRRPAGKWRASRGRRSPGIGTARCARPAWSCARPAAPASGAADAGRPAPGPAGGPAPPQLPAVPGPVLLVAQPQEHRLRRLRQAHPGAVGIAPLLPRSRPKRRGLAVPVGGPRDGPRPLVFASMDPAEGEKCERNPPLTVVAETIPEGQSCERPPP